MATEYIEKQAVIGEILGQPPEAHYPAWYAEQVKAIPPADVRPVVRGRWKDKQLGPWGMVYATCSACKKRVTLEQLHRNFCPNCGADMREGDAE